MRAGILAAIVVAWFCGGGVAWAACPASHARDCVDFDLVPQVSQQVVAGEHLAAKPKPIPAVDPKPAYTGPTVGVSPTVHRTPTVGYRWAID